MSANLKFAIIKFANIRAVNLHKAMRQNILIATGNVGKAEEIKQLLDGLPADIVTLADIGITADVSETGETYAVNALLKATAYCKASGCITLADDSGLEVDALGGRPGVFTARYAGARASDSERWAKLLTELRHVPQPDRAARFRCAIAIAAPRRTPLVVEGTCEGFIAEAPAGSGGFGYDPIFYLPPYGCTMAELPGEIKNTISHRARAAHKAKRVLLEWQLD